MPCSAVLALGFVRKGNLQDAWRTLRIPAFIVFSDSYSVPDAVVCMRAGQDPYVTGAFDPLNRVFNYPPIWIYIGRFLGLRMDHVMFYGTFAAALTVAALFILFRSRTLFGGVLSFLAVVSWPVLYAVERGNSEQFVFFPLICGFFLIHRQKPGSRWITGGTLLTGLTMLKIFPIAAFVALVRSRSHFLKVAAFTVFAAAALILTSGHRLAQVYANTPQNIWLSYGVMNFFTTLIHPFSPALAETFLKTPALPIIAGLPLALAAAMIGMIWQRPLSRVLPRFTLDSARGSLAVAALAIYCFTFLRGSNYCYRLMILTAVVAFLIEEIENGHVTRSLPTALVMILFLSMTSHHALIYQSLTGFVFVAACAWLTMGMMGILQAKELDRSEAIDSRSELRLVA